MGFGKKALPPQAQAADKAIAAMHSAAGSVAGILTSDLLVIRKRLPASLKKKDRTPTDLELHINPAGLGIAAVGAAATLWLMQLNVRPDKVSVCLLYTSPSPRDRS